jgi:uncharacterized protein (DUF433 family)
MPRRIEPFEHGEAAEKSSRGLTFSESHIPCKTMAEKIIHWREFIVSDPAVLGGKPVIEGTRLSVEFVLDLLAAGWDNAALKENYPNLTEDRIRAVLAYAAETFREERFYLLPPTKAAT